MPNEHEVQLAKRFILPAKRDRYLQLFATPKGRLKLTNALDHQHDLDPRYTSRVPTGQQHAGAIAEILKNKGAPADCYMVSSNPALDGRWLPLLDGLRQVIGGGCGTFLSCVPGKLGYFESEDPGERYIVER